MAEITASMVKDLREKTGVGMMDCKAALAATKGDMDAAVDWLRAKGLAKAAKKSTRVAAEGLIGLAIEGSTGALVEVNSETDFVARNAKFQSMVAEIAKLALKSGGDSEKLKTMHFPGSRHAVVEDDDVEGAPGRGSGVQLLQRALGRLGLVLRHAQRRELVAQDLAVDGVVIDHERADALHLAASGGRGRTGHGKRLRHPTAPSICSSIRRFSSNAYSIGSSLAIGSMKPRTIMAIASSSVRPRLIR